MADAAALPEREWKPGDSHVLPSVPESCYPPDAVELEPTEPETTAAHPVVHAAAQALAEWSNAEFTCECCRDETPDWAPEAAVAAPAVLRHVADGLCCGGELYAIADEIERASGSQDGDTGG